MQGYDQRDLPRLRRFARALVPDPAGADALLADALGAGRSCDRLALLARLVALSRLRQGGAPAMGQGTGQGVGKGTGKAAGAAMSQDACEALRAFRQLVPEAREVLALVVVEGIDHGEAALVLGLDRAGLVARLTAARLALGRAMEGQRHGAGHGAGFATLRLVQ